MLIAQKNQVQIHPHTTPFPAMASYDTPVARRSSRISPEDHTTLFFLLQEQPERGSAGHANSADPHANSADPNANSVYVPPWTEPYIIGVAGNSGSGKTSVSQKIILELNQPWTVLLLFDNFYRPLTEEELVRARQSEYDFDCPESLDLDLLVATVQLLKRGEKTEIPVYSFTKHARTEKRTTIYGANVIIIEGILALYDHRLLDLMDTKIYVDTDLDVCLARRLTRDILYRGRDLEGAMRQWERFVKPNAVRYVNPTANHADLVVPRGLANETAIRLMIEHIQKQLAVKLALHMQLLSALGAHRPFDVARYDNVKLLPNNNHTKGIHLILFNVRLERLDFIFYFDRILILLIEIAMEQLTNYEPVTATTGLGYSFAGLRQLDEIVAINIIRSGDCFVNSIKKTFPEISIGKLLIQSDLRTGEPQLHAELIPRSIGTMPYKKCFLFDAQIISGAAAIMAIQVLIDHRVKQSDIVLVCYLCAEAGLRRLLTVFPSVSVVIGKLSSQGTEKHAHNEEGFRDSDWHFRNRFIDSLYFGTD